MNIANLKVGTRLTAGFVTVLAMTMLIIAIGLVRFSAIEQANTKIIERDWVKAEAINVINIGTQGNARRMLEMVLAPDKSQVDQLRQQIANTKQSLDQSIDTLDRLIYVPQGRALLEQLKTARIAYVATFAKLAGLLGEGRKDDAIALLNREALPALHALREPIIALADLQKQIVVASSVDVAQQIHSGKTLMFILGGIALLVGAAASYLITSGLLKQLGGEPQDAAYIAGRIAGGDLQVEIDTKPGDQSSLLHAIRMMRDNLSDIVHSVRGGTDTIATASSQISIGNLDLSSRTEQQASSLEETASSMEELTGTVKQNADNARQANALALSASDIAVKGGCVVTQVVQTMASINESSKKIVDIIGVIDGIAFQTNILALNAAVEAARAGEQGRGFAVVASEVRNLAQRSAAAAKEIKALIGDSVEKVGVGSKLVDQAGCTMEEVVASVKRVTNIIGEITIASQEQTAGIEQINTAITQMDTVTQQNAALVEEAAAAAASLQEQAANLSQIVSIFKLGALAPAASKTHVRDSAPTLAMAPKTAQGSAQRMGHDAPSRRVAPAKSAALAMVH